MTDRPDPLADPLLLSRLVREPPKPAKFLDPTFLFSGSCDYGGRWRAARQPCQRKSVVVAWIGCIHEHMGQLELCPEHNVTIDRERVFCEECKVRGFPGIVTGVIHREMV